MKVILAETFLSKIDIVVEYEQDESHTEDQEDLLDHINDGLRAAIKEIKENHSHVKHLRFKIFVEDKAWDTNTENV